MLSIQQRPWWQQQQPEGMPPPPGTELDPAQPPPPATPLPMSRFDMPQQPQPQAMPDMPQSQQPAPQLAAAKPMPEMPGAEAPEPAPTPAPAPSPEPIAPPPTPDSEALGRDPVRRARIIGAHEGADEQAAKAPVSGIGQGVAQQARDRAVAKYIADHEKPQSKLDTVRQVIGTALSIAPNLRGVGHALMHPPNKTEESIPVLETAAKQEEAQQQAQSGEELKREQIAATKAWREEAIAQKLAALKPATTAKERYLQAMEIPNMTEDMALEYSVNGKVDFKPAPVPKPALITKPGDVLRDPDNPAKIIATNEAKEVADKEDPNHWIAAVRNPESTPEQIALAQSKISDWEKTQKNQRPPVTVNNNWTPQQAAAAQVPVVAGQRNEDFLKTLTPQEQLIVKMIADYDYQMPKGRGALEKNAKYLASAKAYDPAFQPQNYDNIAGTKKSYLGGGKDQANITALNTALVHLGGLDQAAGGLNNSAFQRYNTLANWLVNEVGNPQTKPFQSYRTAFNEEMSRALKGGVATQEEVAQWNHNIDMADSPAKLRSSVETVAHIIAGRISQQQATYERSVGKAPPRPFVSAEAQAVLDRLGTRQQQGGGGYKPGETRNIGGVNYVRDNKGQWHPQ